MVWVFQLTMVYLLFWTMTLFLVLPWHARTGDEVGAAKIPGQADSAPHIHRPLSIVLWTTGVSAALFGLFLLNFRYGWITAPMLDFYRDPVR